MSGFFRIDPGLAERAGASARANGVDLDEVSKRQLANQFHAVMIVESLKALEAEFGDAIWPIVNQRMYEIGKQVGAEIYAMMGFDTEDARGLTKGVDVINACLDIVGEEVSRSKTEVVRHEKECHLSSTLHALDGHHYCGMYQQIYRGSIHAGSASDTAGCNNLSCTKSRGDGYCEIKTWIGRDDEAVPAHRP